MREDHKKKKGATLKLTRRKFLQVSALFTGSLYLKGGGQLSARETDDLISSLKIDYGRDTTTVCVYCSVGCGQIATTHQGKVINIEGDPDHPINQGALCSKGAAAYQIVNNERRLERVKYRAPRSDHWEEVSWKFALERIAKKVKETRDDTWVEQDEQGRVVNHTEGLAMLGCAIVNNEECYLIHKLARALGVVYLEHQARLCHSSTVAALADSFGRGAMTNHWIDIGNSDCIMVIGSNAAENHPVAFRWINEAREKRGAKLISIDPRFTRTSATADMYAPMRSGTDIAFIGGIINYVLQNRLYNKDYVAEFTNASFLINPEFRFEEGLFSGYNTADRRYNQSSWTYQKDDDGIPKRDKQLRDPDTVFQRLKEHFSRYDVATVSNVTGTSRDDFMSVAETFAATGASDKAGTILYSMGTTQHTKAAQNIRTYAILQLLLGNLGIAGGGINAMRGISNVQGSTDHALLFHLLPGYMSLPTADDTSLATYLERNVAVTKDPRSVNYWQNTPNFLVSQLKAFYGEKASPENEFCYDYLPRLTQDCSFLSLVEAMYTGTIKGMLAVGTNPAVSGAQADAVRKGLDNLDWLAVADLWDTETASFWKRPGVDPADIDTEVFLLPAASSLEKEGSISNSGRWSQWRYPAISPIGEAKNDLWIIDQVFQHVCQEYAGSSAQKDQPLLNMRWEYGSNGNGPNAHEVAKEINGYDLRTGRLLSSFAELKDDGSTSSGNWIYSGSYTEEGNKAEKRGLKDPTGIGLYPDWSWAWPVNRRILYNRASCDAQGQPWDTERMVIRWDGTSWTGDVPDFPAASAPEEGLGPFIMTREGFGRLFGAEGLVDGPFPEHYEALESPVENLFSITQTNPAARLWTTEGLDIVGDPKDFPVIASTCRMCEHWQAGAMTRNLPWLAELVPDMFVEMSPSLAEDKGIRHGDKVTIVSARGRIEAYALVTKRVQPFPLNGKLYEQVALPWHFGYVGLATGDSANSLTPYIGDANTQIPEYKAFLCRIENGGLTQ